MTGGQPGGVVPIVGPFGAGKLGTLARLACFLREDEIGKWPLSGRRVRSPVASRTVRHGKTRHCCRAFYWGAVQIPPLGRTLSAMDCTSDGFELRLVCGGLFAESELAVGFGTVGPRVAVARVKRDGLGELVDCLADAALVEERQPGFRHS